MTCTHTISIPLPPEPVEGGRLSEFMVSERGPQYANGQAFYIGGLSGFTMETALEAAIERWVTIGTRHSLTAIADVGDGVEMASEWSGVRWGPWRKL